MVVRNEDRSDPLRARVIADVLALDPVDGAERADIDRFVTEVDRLPSPFERDADPVHVTGSAFVVGPRGVVLLRHLKIGTWLQPGGHIDPGETPWDAARREAAEETGLTVSFLDGTPELVHVSVHDVPDGHTHLDLRYVLDGGVADPSPPPEESQDVAWFGWRAAIATAEPSLAAVLGRLADRFAPSAADSSARGSGDGSR